MGAVSEAVLLLSVLLASQSATGQTPATPACAIAGAVRSGATPLPGVALTLRSGDAVVAATSTDIDGTYRIRVAAAGVVPAAGRAGRVRTCDRGRHVGSGQLPTAPGPDAHARVARGARVSAGNDDCSRRARRDTGSTLAESPTERRGRRIRGGR